MPLDLVATLCELIALPSVNPMGQEVQGEPYFEERVTDYLERLLDRPGIRLLRQKVHPHRENLLALVEGSPSLAEGGKLVLLDAHQDTVPVAGMTIDPFRPAVEGGRIYGRGACDIKGGMVAMLGALIRLVESRPKSFPSLLFAATVNEEHGFSGALAVPQAWQGANRWLPKAPDLAIIAEPTLLNVVVAHKGCVRWRLHTLGRAAHSSTPQQGENAFFHMARVLLALESYQQQVTGLAAHPRCGHPTLSVGTIHGGLSVNTVPDRCTIEIDRRLVPGEQPRAAQEQVIDYLARTLGPNFPLVHDEPFLSGTGLADRDNGPLGESLVAVARRVAGAAECLGVPFGTNAACYSAAGIPSVVFGPGSIEQAHTADEWLACDQLQAASEILYEWCRNPLVD